MLITAFDKSGKNKPAGMRAAKEGAAQAKKRASRSPHTLGEDEEK